MSDLPPLQQSLCPPFVKGKGNAWHAPLRIAQSVFLQYHDGRNQRRHRCRQLQVIQRGKTLWYEPDKQGKRGTNLKKE